MLVFLVINLRATRRFLLDDVHVDSFRIDFDIQGMLFFFFIFFPHQIIHVPQVGALANPVFGKGGFFHRNPRCRTRCEGASSSGVDLDPEIEDPALISAATRPTIVIVDRPEPAMQTRTPAVTGELLESTMNIRDRIAITPNTLGTPVQYGVDHIHTLENIAIEWHALRGERIGSAIIRFSDLTRDRFHVEATSDPRLFAERYHQRFERYITYFRLNVAVHRFDIHRGILADAMPLIPVDSGGHRLRTPAIAQASYIFNPEAVLASDVEQEFIATYLVAHTLGRSHTANTHTISLTWSIQYLTSRRRPDYMNHLGRLVSPQVPDGPVPFGHIPGHPHPRLQNIVPVIPDSRVAMGVMPAPRLDIQQWINSIQVRRPGNPTEPQGDLISATYPLNWGTMGEIAQVHLSFHERVTSMFYVDVGHDPDRAPLVQLYYERNGRYLTYIRIDIGVSATIPPGTRVIQYVDRHIEPEEYPQQRSASWTFDAYQRYGEEHQRFQRASYRVDRTESTPGSHRIRLYYHITYLESETPPPYARRRVNRSKQLDRGKAHEHFPIPDPEPHP